MKHVNKFLVFFLLVTGVLSSCKKELERTNVNPNNPESVDPEYLLNTSVFNTINLFGGSMRREALSHYSNYVSVGGGQLQRYYTFASTVNGYWQSSYVSCLQPVHQIITKYSDNPLYKNRVAIAKIFESYIYSNVVAIWGSIPKTDALSGEVYTSYVKEEEVYYDLMNTLKLAAASIDLNGDKYIKSADAVYGGDLLKWKKFANTLRLRLAVRISNANSTKAQEVITEILADESNTIKTAAETARAVWGTTPDTWSFLYNYNVQNAAANASSLNVVSESLIQHMLPYNDPRLPVYAKPASQGPYKNQYWGQPKTTSVPAGVTFPNGNPHSSLGQLDYSQIGDYFTKPDAEYVFLSYEEAAFLKAEVALKGWGGSKPADQYYAEGITASMQKYGVTQAQINTYLNTPGIKWNTAVDTIGRGAQFRDYIGITTSAILTPNPFRQIVMQEWLAGFYNAMDAWTLLRRTQVLEFPPHFNPDGSEGGTVGFAYIPQRLNYPGIEYQVNTAEVNKALQWLGGPDNLRTKLWFALPTKQNPFLPVWQ
ncbi:MAG: SusD/RagB family nutrient-binding outer membrane lipoprotein [Sphingobacteriales bacterium]|nr:MAG: SusD/RagB family nutrient-binding outer membrane lipoprotein [Sphingobacteriales bacterium]